MDFHIISFKVNGGIQGYQHPSFTSGNHNVWFRTLMLQVVDKSGNCLLLDADYSFNGHPLLIFPKDHEQEAYLRAKKFNCLISLEYKEETPAAFHQMHQVPLGGGMQPQLRIAKKSMHYFLVPPHHCHTRPSKFLSNTFTCDKIYGIQRIENQYS